MASGSLGSRKTFLESLLRTVLDDIFDINIKDNTLVINIFSKVPITVFHEPKCFIIFLDSENTEKPYPSGFNVGKEVNPIDLIPWYTPKYTEMLNLKLMLKIEYDKSNKDAIFINVVSELRRLINMMD